MWQEGACSGERADPDEVTESKVVDAQRLPFSTTQDLLNFENSPQTVMLKLEPFFGLRLREDEPPGAICNARPTPHALPLRR